MINYRYETGGVAQADSGAAPAAHGIASMDAELNWRPAVVAVVVGSAAAVDCVAAGDCASKYDAPFQLRMQRLLLRLLLDYWSASTEGCPRNSNKVACCTLPVIETNNSFHYSICQKMRRRLSNMVRSFFSKFARGTKRIGQLPGSFSST